MAKEDIDYEDLKRRGFLKQKQDAFFVLRARMSSGVYNSDNLKALSEIARKYGRGIIHATTRQGLEIPFVRVEDIPDVEKEVKRAGIETGTSGARLRAITVCPGNNWCKFGLVNTFSLQERLEKEFGIRCGVDLPHKLKIAISGCPNGCTRPQSSDIGIHGQVDTGTSDKRIGYAVYIGGCAGRMPRDGFKLDKIFTEEEVLSLVKKVVEAYKLKAKPRQRLSSLIDEIGRERFLEESCGIIND